MSRPLQFFNYQKGILSAQKISMEEVANQVGTPAYVYSADAFLNPLKELQSRLKSLDSLICFALKANSNLSILKMLSLQGAGMDLVTGGELFRASRAEVPAHRIVFSGVGKTQQDMIKALEYQGTGIFSFNVESIPELKTLNATADRLGLKARVALRYNPDVDPKTHPYISTGLKKNKFGLEKYEILEICKNLSHYPAIELNGLSIHIGSQLTSLTPIEDALIRLKQLIKQVNLLIPTPLSFVDLGGGLGITYKKEKVPSLKDYASLIKKHFGINNEFQRKSDKSLKILIEPGRTLSGNSGILLTRILYRKTRRKKDFLIVDAGMNDLVRPALYGSYHEIIPFKKPLRKFPLRKFDIVGPVCESADCFASDRFLPEHLNEGDFLAIMSAGAYGFTMASQYNSRPRPPEVLIQNGQIRVIRSRETYDDLCRGE